jgi:hypothetical protein
MILRPVSPAEFAVRFGLEPVDVEWLMGAYRRGMSDDKLRSEIQTLGCSAGDAQRLLEQIAKETAALVAGPLIRGQDSPAESLPARPKPMEARWRWAIDGARAT